MGKKATKSVQVPMDLWRRVGAFIKRHGGYFNEAEYIREAVRAKLDFDESKERGATREFEVSPAGPVHPAHRERPPP